MKEWPEFNKNGDLPAGIHGATIEEVVEHFGTGVAHRQVLAQRLRRIYSLAVSTGHLDRFIIFGSFVTSKPDPGDIDIFMLMDDLFEINKVTGEAAIIFDHMAAQNYEGASIFWIQARGIGWRRGGCGTLAAQTRWWQPWNR